MSLHAKIKQVMMNRKTPESIPYVRFTLELESGETTEITLGLDPTVYPPATVSQKKVSVDTIKGLGGAPGQPLETLVGKDARVKPVDNLEEARANGWSLWEFNTSKEHDASLEAGLWT